MSTKIKSPKIPNKDPVKSPSIAKKVDNVLQGQAIEKFNIHIRSIISSIRPCVAIDKESAIDYGTFETVMNNILLPTKPMIVINLFKNVICDNEKYRGLIKNKDDSIFSCEGIYEEYSNVFNSVLKANSNGNSTFIANFIVKQIIEKKSDGNKTSEANEVKEEKEAKVVNDIKQNIDPNGNFDFNRVDCDKLMNKNKKEITGKIAKYRKLWDQLDDKNKESVWTSLKILVFLVDKYFN
jgi:hypothetical protein